jgi:hypothetical protein
MAGNLWEDVVKESAASLAGEATAIADIVRGGKAPPFSVKLSGEQKRQMWLLLTPEERKARLDVMEPQAQERLWREIGRPDERALGQSQGGG